MTPHSWIGKSPFWFFFSKSALITKCYRAWPKDVGGLNCARREPLCIFVLIYTKVRAVRDERPFLCVLTALIQLDNRNADFCFYMMITIILDIIFPNICVLWCNIIFLLFCLSNRLQGIYAFDKTSAFDFSSSWLI